MQPDPHSESLVDERKAAERAAFIRARLPKNGLFAGQTWRISPEPFALGEKLAREIDRLGRVLQQFYKAVNLLYRQSIAGRQSAWIATLLEQGKSADQIEWQRADVFKNDIPRVIRPDILLTENGFSITELDSVPGGIGLTDWLNQTYADAGSSPVLGGPRGMAEGFRDIFGGAARVHLVISDESATYRPEMEWLADRMGSDRFQIRDSDFIDFDEGDAVYRFFELFDLANVKSASRIASLAAERKITVTPPFKTIFEEKLLFGLFWNRNLRDFWRQNLGESFFNQLQRIIPFTWIVDPEPLPPHGAYPRLNLTNWEQLKTLSQRERELILKVSGYSPEAWGSRGVYLGSDLSLADWSEAVDLAVKSFPKNPFVLQEFHKPKSVGAQWFNFEAAHLESMPARVRLCPYYFLHGEGDAAKPKLGGVLATLNPADKKIIHGMTDAILAPCTV